MQTVTSAISTVAKKQGKKAHAEPIKMRKLVGSIVFEVVIHFDPDAKETMNDKKLRLIRRDMEAML
jgi:hypothetical protein